MSAFKERWDSYRATKGTLVWAFAAGAIATLVVGFAGLDWRTAGSASSLASDAARQGRAELAATICVDRFMAAPDLATRLTALKEERAWSRRSMIEDAGWVSFSGMQDPIEDAAALCANQLVEMQAPEDQVVDIDES
jgi:hypothetical protein